MKRDQFKSTIVTLSVVGGVVVLGSLGYMVMLGNKIKKNKKIPETSVEPSRQEIMNGSDLKLLKNLEEKEGNIDKVMRGVIDYVLCNGIESREDFLKKFTRLMLKSVVEDNKELEKIPKNIEELEQLVKKYNKIENYEKCLNSNPNDSYCGTNISRVTEIKRKRKRISIKVVCCRENRNYSKNRKRNNNRVHNFRRDKRKVMEG